MLRFLTIFVLSFFLFAYTAVANNYTPEEISLCFIKAGKYYHVPPLLLWGIARVESNFNPMAVNHNKRSYDIGIMQVNSRWLPVLRKYGIQEKDLYDPCKNIFIGAWILSKCYMHYHTWYDALSCYNTGRSYFKSVKGARYTWKVWKAIEKVINQDREVSYEKGTF